MHARNRRIFLIAAMIFLLGSKSLSAIKFSPWGADAGGVYYARATNMAEWSMHGFIRWIPGLELNRTFKVSIKGGMAGVIVPPDLSLGKIEKSWRLVPQAALLLRTMVYKELFVDTGGGIEFWGAEGSRSPMYTVATGWRFGGKLHSVFLEYSGVFGPAGYLHEMKYGLEFIL